MKFFQGFSQPKEKKILELLQAVQVNEAGTKSIVDILSNLVIRDRNVTLILNNQESSKIEQDCRNALQSYGAVKQVNVIFTQELKAPATPSATQASKPSPAPATAISGVKQVIAVSSGKGGVGKSTIAVNLAVSLAKLGYKTGLADVDIYGPSVAYMMNVTDKPQANEQGKMLAPESFGVKCISMGMLVDQDSPVVWRAPMATKALAQLLKNVAWDVDGELDFLVIDLPPGTGDIHISLAQHYKVDGVITVCTPQEMAMLDVQKSVQMYRKLKLNLVGLVENMSYFEDESGKQHRIFGQKTASEMAKRLDLELLAALPIDSEVASASEAQKPIATIANKNELFLNLAKKIVAKLG